MGATAKLRVIALRLQELALHSLWVTSPSVSEGHRAAA
jgi:hypothetical protein